jgi:hypothetical protein
MKEVIKKILKESLSDNKYRTCDHFNEPEHKQFCKKLDTLQSWLANDLGLKDIIKEKLSVITDFSDMNQKYQYPLELLSKTGTYPEILNEDGVYVHNRLKNAGLVLDTSGNWHKVNKLNTNYRDLAELLTELFIKGGIIHNLNNKNALGIKNYLTSIKDKLPRLLDKYFHIEDYKDFVRNIEQNSKEGKAAEDIVFTVLTNYGVKVVYQGGDGDFIDMLFGCDSIIKSGGKVYTIQIKNNENNLIDAMSDKRYRRIDYFSAPTDYGIILYRRNGKSYKINKEGKVIE